jgi:tRNA G10  N-methylase Trm11
VLRKHLLEKSLELVACRGKTFWLGRTIAVHDPFEFQARDVERPVQRAIYSIPPRLAKIMINLSGAKSGVLLDPFCGIGGILQEAALMNFDIRGVDSNRKCIPDCMRNLEWLGKKYGLRIRDMERKILAGDARKLSAHFGRETMDVIVTEPWLGPPLRQRPDTRTARLIIGEVSELYEKALREMAKVLKPGGRIVITSPFFEVQGRTLEVDMEGMAQKNNCTVIDPLEGMWIGYERPFSDYEERHNTLRKISVLERRGSAPSFPRSP